MSDTQVEKEENASEVFFIKVNSYAADTTFISSLLNATKKFTILIWYLIQSFFSKIYSRQKCIRNQFILITGSGTYLGISVTYYCITLVYCFFFFFLI